MTIETSAQFKKMQTIGAIVANCLEYAKAKVRVGMSTGELDRMADEFLNRHGAVSAPRSSYRFPGAVCISIEEEAAHGVPGDRVLQDGDLINIDVSAHRDGFYADNGESFVLGKGTPKKKRLCRAAHRALGSGLAGIRPGAKISTVGRQVEKVAKSMGFTVIRNLGGHGVGASLHEEPRFIPSYFDFRDKRTFADHQVVAIEPFVSNGATEVLLGEDGWTLFHEGHYTTQKEHTIMVSRKKPYIFTNPTKSFA